MTDRELLEAIHAQLERWSAIASAVEAQLPRMVELVEQAGPMIESVGKNPLLKMLRF